MLRLSSSIYTEDKEDVEYEAFLDALNRQFNDIASKEPLFTTDCSESLWDNYFGALMRYEPQDAQYHNCRTCKAFIGRYGGLVTIDERGRTRSALWRIKAPDDLLPGIKAMLDAVELARVTGVFVTSDNVLGEATKGKRHKLMPSDPANLWSHMHVSMPESKVLRSHLTARQVSAEKLGEYHSVVAALSQVNADVLAKAVQLMESESLYRSEKVLGPAKWLSELKARLPKNKTAQHNIIMRAVALAPAGFCHPRSSVWWSLLGDLEAVGFDYAARRFRAKMSPEQYQRPQAAPSCGAIEAAEKLVEKLGIARSLERRFARLDEIQKLWEPTKNTSSCEKSVFGHLKLGDVSIPVVEQIMKPVTWAKFIRTVLPTAVKMQILAPAMGSYCAYLTAAHDDAPPILQWDLQEKRNPVSFYLYTRESSAMQWGVSSGWRDVGAISLNPAKWAGEFSHVPNSALFVINGCVDSNESAGNGLFPEIMRSELHGCRAVIERYSATAKIGGRESASACGMMFSEQSPVAVRVTTAFGTAHEYRIDRWD